MQTFSSILEIQKALSPSLKADKEVSFVPTMGFLHEGHLSLVKRARKENDIVVVSIYVNPLQFGPKEDFSKYPRDLEKDKKMLQKENVDILFLPNDNEIYGNRDCRDEAMPRLLTKKNRLSAGAPRVSNIFSVTPPEYLTNCLCGASRPGHFEGVSTIVAKLFNIVMPTRAYFGQKDYQQTLVIKKMVKDLNFKTEIIVCETKREKDDLAMSSRNFYLNPNERKSATILCQTLKFAQMAFCRDEALPRLSTKKNRLSAGAHVVQSIVSRSKTLINKEPLAKIDYFEIRDAEDLSEIKEIKKGQKIIIACAVFIGKTRLIDNMLIILS